jgi:hypothetical protein
MQIADLRIDNFRGVRQGRVRLGPHTVFVGPSNCGKTTIIEALALLFGRDRLVRSLTEHDFYGSDPQPADRIRLVATLVEFDGDEPGEHPDWFGTDRAVPKWFDPEAGEVHPTRADPGWRLACQIGFAARFDRPSLEVETVRYFHDDDDVVDVFDEDSWTAVPQRLLRDIGFFLVPASRTWDRIISFGSELFRRVVASGDGPPAQAVLVERDRLRNPEKPLEADANLRAIVQELDRELEGFFPSAPKLQLRVTSTDSDGVLEAVIPHYMDSASGSSLPARRQGSGLISLQGLLLLFEFGRRRASAGKSFWMALEEPELHLSPAMQRRLVQRLQALSSQTFVSTHSPMVAAMSDPAALAILRNEAGVLNATPLPQESLALAPNAIRKLFQLNRIDTIDALMHDVVLIPEGRTDFDWLHLLLRAIDARQNWSASQDSAFGAHVGVIPTHDASVISTFEALKRLHPKVCCLVDGDASGIEYAARLQALPNGPLLILQWPEACSIEDIVGWIARAAEMTILRSLENSDLPAMASADELVARLKSMDRAAHGLKGNRVAYEAVADAISRVDACVDRARLLLNGVSDALLGRRTPLFVEAPAGSNIRVLQL